MNTLPTKKPGDPDVNTIPTWRELAERFRDLVKDFLKEGKELEPVLPHDADDRDLLHRRMLQQTVLDFLRRQPLARHLEQVVGPAAVGEITVGVAPDHIARDVPLSQKSLLRLLHLLPVADRARAAAHPQGAHLAVGQLAPRVIAHLDLEPRDDGPERPRAHVSGTIGDEYVPTP